MDDSRYDGKFYFLTVTLRNPLRIDHTPDLHGIADLKVRDGKAEVVVPKRLPCTHLCVRRPMLEIIRMLERSPDIFGARFSFEISSDGCVLPADWHLYIEADAFSRNMQRHGYVLGFDTIAEIMCESCYDEATTWVHNYYPTICTTPARTTRRLISAFRALEREGAAQPRISPSQFQIRGAPYVVSAAGVISQEVSSEITTPITTPTVNFHPGGVLASNGSLRGQRALLTHAMGFRRPSPSVEGEAASRAVLIVTSSKCVPKWRALCGGDARTLELVSVGDKITEESLRSARAVIATARYLSNRSSVASAEMWREDDGGDIKEEEDGEEEYDGHDDDFQPYRDLPEREHVVEAARGRICRDRVAGRRAASSRLLPWVIRWACVLIDDPEMLSRDLTHASYVGVYKVILQTPSEIRWVHVSRPNFCVDEILPCVSNHSTFHPSTMTSSIERCDMKALLERTIFCEPDHPTRECSVDVHPMRLSTLEMARYYRRVAQGDSFESLTKITCLPSSKTRFRFHATSAERLSLAPCPDGINPVFFDRQRADVLGESPSRCGVCMENRCDALLPCAHALCFSCAERMSNHCPFCRRGISTSIGVLDGHVRIYGTKVSQVAESVAQCVRAGEQVVVMCEYVEVTHMIEWALGGLSIPTSRLSGPTRNLIKAVQSDGARAFLCSTHELEGVVFERVSTVLFVHPLYGVNRDRIARIATPNAVNRKYFVGRDTLDESYMRSIF